MASMQRLRSCAILAAASVLTLLADVSPAQFSFQNQAPAPAQNPFQGQAPAQSQVDMFGNPIGPGHPLYGQAAPVGRTRRQAIEQRAGQAQEVIQSFIEPEVKVRAYIGTRVFDAVTGELLDDAQEVMIPEDQRDLYYDDGTHGDETANDGVYALVESSDDFLSSSNQRIKERLIQALYEANRLDPIDFYGFDLMAADRRNREPRSKRWKIVEDPEGPGRRLVTVAAEKPLTVPNYWEQYEAKDQKLVGENGWAQTFLDEYRVEEGNLQSEFYPTYIPQPPAMPDIPPPGQDSWTPYQGIQETEAPRNQISNPGRRLDSERQTYFDYDQLPGPAANILRGRR